MTRSKPIWVQVLELLVHESELRCRKFESVDVGSTSLTFQRKDHNGTARSAPFSGGK